MTFAFPEGLKDQRLDHPGRRQDPCLLGASTVRDSKLEESVVDPTAPFKFFALSRVGLEVEATDGGVRVEKVEEEEAVRRRTSQGRYRNGPGQ